MGDEVRRILHCDMDCFYAAVHTREAPDLAGQPVVVGGNPSGRGVVAAANYEARRHGIHSAMPAAQALRLCPNTVFLRPDFELYRRESEPISAIYRKYTPLIQTLSLDEAYLDVSEHLGTFGSATAVAHDIRRRVREERNLTVSVGVGANKLVAKIASDYDKPDGLTVVRPGAAEAFLAPLSVRRLHGIGPATARALAELGVEKVAQLRTLSLDQLLARFGHHGRTLWEYARAIDERPVAAHHERKSLGMERTFQSDIKELAEMDGIVQEMATTLAAGLKRRNLCAANVTVKARYPDFTTVTRSHTLIPTADGGRLASCASDLLRKTEAGQRSVRLLGVSVASLVPARLEQLELFASET